MKHLLRITGACLFAALWLGMPDLLLAQTVEPLTNGTYTFSGLNVTLSGCTYYFNGLGSTDCSSDGAELKQVSTGRGTVTIEIIATSGSTLFPSAIIGLNGVQFTLALTTNTPSSATISSIQMMSYGTNSTGTENNFYGSYTGNQITASIAQNAASSTCTDTAGGTSCSATLSGGANSLSVSGGLLFAGGTGSGFKLSSAAFTFTTAPEPPSWPLFLVGLGGLAFVRRRCKATVRKPASA